MKTYTLDLSDSASARLAYNPTYLFEISIMCEIPADTNCVKVIGTIDFKSVVFDKKFYNAFKGKIDIFDLSELKASSSYSQLNLLPIRIAQVVLVHIQKLSTISAICT